MKATCVVQWFGEEFNKLHPMLQTLHRHGGTLSGPVLITFAKGMAGWFGRRIAGKMGVPVEPGEHHMMVEITHCVDGMHWDRCFDHGRKFYSVFKPVRTIHDGYWLETTGLIQLHLTVDIVDGGWYWRTQGACIKGVRFPKMFLPKTNAYKNIDGDAYHFHVGIGLPVLGELFSYSGMFKYEVSSLN